MTDSLFTYPNRPGAKTGGPSRQAARSMDGAANQLRLRVLARLSCVGPSTADEVAAMMNESVLSIRPRFTELLRLDLIEDTGQRRKNRSGRNATVWRKR